MLPPLMPEQPGTQTARVCFVQQDPFQDRHPGIAEAGNGLGADRLCPGAASLPSPSSPRHLAGVLVGTLFVALVFLVIPLAAVALDEDSSWCAVLSYAHQKSWQFGKEIVYTYGPAGFLITPWSTGEPFVLRMVSDITLTLVVAAGLCLVAWRVRLLCRLLLLGTVILLAPNLIAPTDLLLYIGLLCWGALCLVESGGRLVMAAVGLACLAAFATLVKMNFLFAATLSIGAVTCDLALRGRSRLALCLVLGFAAGVASLCMLLGQNLSHFGSFLANGIAICLGYNQGLTYKLLPKVQLGGMAAAMAALSMTVAGALTAFDPNDKRLLWRRGLLLAWMVSLLFITWKHGFIPGDRAHIGFFLIFIPALALALEALPRQTPAGRAAVQSIGTFCCVICALTLQSAYFPGYLNMCARHPLRAISRNVRAIFNPTEYWQGLNRHLESRRQRAALPRLRTTIGPAGVDVLGNEQAYSWYNQFNYQPRPVFQSYLACTPSLMRLNEDFYVSKPAPEYVLLSLADSKGFADSRGFPPLADALVLRSVLANYALIDAEGPFLLLQSRQTGSPKLSPLRDGKVRIGERLDLWGAAGQDLWMELDLKPTLAGRARQVVYKSTPVRLAVWHSQAGGKLGEFRAPPLMMKAGFLASPLLRGNADVLTAYGADTNAMIRPGAFSIEVDPADRPFWQSEARFRIYRLQERLCRFASKEFLQRVKFPGFATEPCDFCGSSNAVLSVAGLPVVLLPPGGYMRFEIPDWAGSAMVSHVYLSSPGVDPAAQAEFRVEEELANGTVETLRSTVAAPERNPGKHSLTSYTISLSGQWQTHRKLVLKTVPGTPGTPTDALTCWAGLEFQ
jgi:hypothetical protein